MEIYDHFFVIFQRVTLSESPIFRLCSYGTGAQIVMHDWTISCIVFHYCRLFHYYGFLVHQCNFFNIYKVGMTVHQLKG